MASIQLAIAEPCHENWNQMLPDEKGRFCLSCQKTVVDFTSMSDRQVFDYFKDYKGNTCGQFSPEQLDRPIAKPKNSGIGRWKYFWQVLLPAVFAFHKAQAQPQIVGKPARLEWRSDTTKKTNFRMMGAVASITVAKPLYRFDGKIINERKQPIPFATITASNGKTIFTDSLGQFTISLMADDSLMISNVGYIERKITPSKIEPMEIQKIEVAHQQLMMQVIIEMKPAEAKLDEVVVVGYGAVRCYREIAGSVSVVKRETLSTETKNLTKTPVLPQLKIFPNPIQPGQSFQIALQVKKTGNYLFKITDASGKVLLEEKRNITNLNQTETLDGTALQQAGIYFINISNPADKKDKGLNGRIVVL